MAERNCCVKSCRRRSHDHRGRKIPNGLTFHCFPAWRRNEGGHISELTERRRAAWVAAVGRSDITFDHIPTPMRVCSRHFHSGKPAYEMLESYPDWVPSLHLGHREGHGRRTGRFLLSEQPQRDQKQRWTAETGHPHVSRTPQRQSEGGPMRPAVRPWRDIKSLLQSALQHKNSINKQPGDETQQQPPAAAAAAKKKDLSFRDFFRDALEASLEASSRSRTRSAPQPSIFRDYKVELNFRLPMVNEENQTCEESSSSSSPSPCLNCVRLQRRIVELQEKLSRITEEEEDTEASPVSNRLPPDQVLQSPETVHMEEAEPAWMEPLSPPQGDLHEEDQDVDLPASPAVSQDTSPKQLKLKRTPRFQKSWLKIFWFLRYSQTLDHMWCHVCRLHADNSHQNLSLIKGSKMFKIHNIKKHSYSKYHRENLERYMLHV